MTNMDDIEVVTSGLTIQEEDKQSVLQLARELDRRWNERNAGAFADLFEPYSDFRFHTGFFIVGKKSIEEFWRTQVFPGLAEGVRHVVTARRVRFVTDNVAIGDGNIRVIELMEGQEQEHLATEVTVLVVKKAGCWYISAARLSTLVPE
jgi:uncharacterized protein (TIGR02246 family)